MSDGARSVRDELSSLKIDRLAAPAGRRTPRFLWAVAAALLVLGAGVLYRLTLGAPTLVRVAYAERGEAGAAGAGAASAGVVLTGSGYIVTGDRYISIGVRVPGRIDAYFVDESDSVKKGQALVQLDQRDYLAALERAQAALELARANVALAQTETQRLRSLRAQEIASQSALDVKESNSPRIY